MVKYYYHKSDLLITQFCNLKKSYVMAIMLYTYLFLAIIICKLKCRFILSITRT